jgi:hypothetical protein
MRLLVTRLKGKIVHKRTMKRSALAMVVMGLCLGIFNAAAREGQGIQAVRSLVDWFRSAPYCYDTSIELEGLGRTQLFHVNVSVYVRNPSFSAKRFRCRVKLEQIDSGKSWTREFWGVVEGTSLDDWGYSLSVVKFTEPFQREGTEFRCSAEVVEVQEGTNH